MEERISTLQTRRWEKKIKKNNNNRGKVGQSNGKVEKSAEKNSKKGGAMLEEV